ncbi:ribosome maturation factor RimM [Thermophagus sp. OGC60D27]|uniref:ribosome maturation factor RimM n=1 Tax=Thermophagus sp. OGC60D27 TaxID=3458415 RepID=UPI00403805AB
MLEKSDFRSVGVLSRPHGIAGEAAIRLSPEAMNWDLSPSFIFIEINNELVPFRISGMRYKADDIILVKSPFLSSEEEIRALMGCSVYLSDREIEQIPAGLNNLNAFIGFKVIDTNHGMIGEIFELQDISGNPLFRIHKENDEILIPVAEEFIIKINNDEKIIEMKIPEGLLDINN